MGELLRMVFKVKGVTYNGRQEIIAKMKLDTPLRLVAEPENEFDPNAVAVQAAINNKVHHIGYVPREETHRLLDFLEGGESIDAKVRNLIGGGKFLFGVIAEVVIEGYVAEHVVTKGTPIRKASDQRQLNDRQRSYYSETNF